MQLSLKLHRVFWLVAPSGLGKEVNENRIGTWNVQSAFYNGRSDENIISPFSNITRSRAPISSSPFMDEFRWFLDSICPCPKAILGEATVEVDVPFCINPVIDVKTLSSSGQFSSKSIFDQLFVKSVLQKFVLHACLQEV